MRKRRAGWFKANPRATANGAGSFIPAAPNLGTEKGDLEKLIQSITARGVGPGLIIIDTLAQTIGGADAGMAIFAKNATALAAYFNALVLVVHHTGHGDGLRMRGFSGLPAACDGKNEGAAKEAQLVFEKCKDAEGWSEFSATLRSVSLASSKTGQQLIRSSSTASSRPASPNAERKNLVLRCVPGAFRSNSAT
jgi:hypothetical protein